MHRAIHETPDHTRWAVTNQLRTHDLRNYKKKQITVLSNFKITLKQVVELSVLCLSSTLLVILNILEVELGI